MSSNSSGANSSSGSTGDGSTTSGDAGTQTPEFVTAEKLTEALEPLLGTRNWTQSKIKELTTAVSEIKEIVLAGGKKTDDGDGKKKPDERLANAERQIGELTAKLTQAEQEARSAKNKDRLRELTKGKVRDDGFEAFYRLEGGKFGDVQLEEGKTVFGLVENPYTSVDSYLKDFLAAHPFLAANTRTSGTGIPGKGTTSTRNGGMTVEQLRALPEAERVKILSKDPALRKEYALSS